MKNHKRARTNEEFGLEVKSFPKNKQWAVDQDYVSKLTEAEKAWLGQFNQEFYRGTVNQKDPKTLHNTPELARDCYNRNNASNRDLMSIAGTRVVGSKSVHDGEGNEIDLLDTVADYDTNIIAFENEYDKQALKKRK